MFENNKEKHSQSARIYLSSPTTEKVYSSLSKEEFKTESINFLKEKIYPESPPKKIQDFKQLKSSLKSKIDKRNEEKRIQKKVVV